MVRPLYTGPIGPFGVVARFLGLRAVSTVFWRASNDSVGHWLLSGVLLARERAGFYCSCSFFTKLAFAPVEPSPKFLCHLSPSDWPRNSWMAGGRNRGCVVGRWPIYGLRLVDLAIEELVTGGEVRAVRTEGGETWRLVRASVRGSPGGRGQWAADLQLATGERVTVRHHRVQRDRGSGRVGCEAGRGGSRPADVEGFQRRLHALLAAAERRGAGAEEHEGGRGGEPEAARERPATPLQVGGVILLPWHAEWHAAPADGDVGAISESTVDLTVTATTLVWDETAEPGEEVSSAAPAHRHA